MPKPSKMVAARRQRIVDVLLEVLTSPDSPITAEDIYHFILTAHFFDVAKTVDKFLREFVNHPDVQQEVCVAVVTHTLNRLLTGLPGDEPAASQTEKNISPDGENSEPASASPEPPKPAEPVKSPPVEHHVWRCDRRE